MNWITVAVALAVVNLSFCGHAVNPHFMEWLKANYKPEEVKAFIRDELTTGSFGGGIVTKETNDRPVVLVHGLNNEAGSFWKIVRDMTAAGFPHELLFATTWGRGVEQMNLNVALSCGHVRHIRRFIQAVLKYTGAQQIDIIGYSMGSPLARKAILGGKCVDDPNVALGPSLQSRVHTYISVAGANQGSHLCMLPFFDICNMNTGLMCNSKFLQDINWFKNYESTYKSFNLASTGDFVVGYMTSFIHYFIFSRPAAKEAEEKKQKNSFTEVKKYLNSKRRDVRHTELKKAPKGASVKRNASPKVQKRAQKAKASPKKSAPAKKASPSKKSAPKRNEKRAVKKTEKKH
ncbi:hypothetical protein CAEBREN_29500 [Caenorhabditis brenneri]|uniref:Uncharacterized protein n=1 Tax=Caenorhabditis brenneri TaxID=135651 RepID=G0NYK9_CAEBE|nr:hypothetical protein CAEBREN_29500 [Caenorhabditis brenneri]